MYDRCRSEAVALGRRSGEGCCLRMIIAVLSALLLFAVGLIFGTVFAGTLAAYLAEIIVFAVVLAIMILVIAIYLCCTQARCNCNSD